MTDSLIGQTLAGRYHFEALLGEGSFANVYRTTDLHRRVSLAAKVLRSDIAHDPTFSERFRREAAVLERLQHPNIVRYYGLVEIEEPAHHCTFILMDYVPGDTLDTLLERHPGPFKPYASFTYLTPLAAALHYAHSEGIIHRDLKPANILLHENGTLYVTDFGLARILNQASTLTVGMSIGTPYFMSPEQITGAPITPAADIYSLGVILYRMYTGQLPFRGQSPDAVGSSLTERVTHEHVYTPPQRPSHIYPTLSPAVEEVLLRTLAKDPLRRYPSISALYDALAEAVGAPPIALIEPPVQASSQPVEPPNIRPPEWSRFMPPISGPSVAEPPRNDSDTAEIEVSGPTSEQITLDQEMPQVTLRRSRVVKDPTRETIEHPAPPDTAPHLEEQLAAHRSRTIPAIKVARERPAFQAPLYDSGTYPPSVPPRRRNWLFIAALVGALLIAAAVCAAVVYLLTNSIDDTGSEPTHPVVSAPDQSASQEQPPAVGQRFAFDSRRSGNLDLYIMNIDGSGLRQITDTPEAERGPAWSPDGLQIAFYGAESEQGNYDIFLINGDGTDRRNLTQSPSVDDRYPTWSPDGSQIAYHSNQDGDYDLYIINLDGTNVRNITNNGADDLGPDWSPDGSQIAFHTNMWGSSYEIALIDLNTGAVSRLTSNSGIHSFPTWSPDGTRLAFHTLASDDTANIFLMRTDGTSLQQLTYGTVRSIFPDWSPDGATIIYQTGLDFESSIAIISINGGTPEPLTGSQMNYLPEWAPYP